MSGKVRTMTLEEATSMTVDAKVVALRWDVSLWDLVLDVDVQESERAESPVRRGCLLFSGMSDMTWNLDRARLPNGCLLTSGIDVADVGKGFFQYTIGTMAAVFGADDKMEPYPVRPLTIEAMGLSAAVSVAGAQPGEHGLSLEVREELASLRELVQVAAQSFDAGKP